jgi:hypothetical protein
VKSWREETLYYFYSGQRDFVKLRSCLIRADKGSKEISRRLTQAEAETVGILGNPEL